MEFGGNTLTLMEEGATGFTSSRGRGRGGPRGRGGGGRAGIGMKSGRPNGDGVGSSGNQAQKDTSTTAKDKTVKSQDDFRKMLDK